MYQFVMLPEKSDGIDASGTTLWQEQIFTRDQVRILHACRPNAEKPEAGNVTALFVFLQFNCLAYRGVIMHCHVNQTLTCLHGPSHTHISTVHIHCRRKHPSVLTKIEVQECLCVVPTYVYSLFVCHLSSDVTFIHWYCLPILPTTLLTQLH